MEALLVGGKVRVTLPAGWARKGARSILARLALAVSSLLAPPATLLAAGPAGATAVVKVAPRPGTSTADALRGSLAEGEWLIGERWLRLPSDLRAREGLASGARLLVVEAKDVAVYVRVEGDPAAFDALVGSIALV